MAWLDLRVRYHLTLSSRFAQVTPRVETIAILFRPAVADVLAIIHVWDHHVADAVVGLTLRLAHGGTQAANDKHHARRACDQPLAVHLPDVLDMDSLARWRLKEDDRIPRARLEAFRVSEWKRRDHNSHS